MTSAQPNEPNWPVPTTTTAPRQHGNRLAKASLVLALVPIVAWILNYGVQMVVYRNCGILTGCQVNEALAEVAVVFTLTMYALIALASIGAIVSGILALRRVRRYPPQQAWRGFAIAGLTVGILEVVGTLCVVGLIFLAFSAG